MRIVRSKRKTLSVCVTREGEVLVRAPYGVTDDYIERFVQRHRRWIEKRVAAAGEHPSLDLKDGSAVVLFGTEYTIGTGKARLAEGFIFLPEAGREEAFTRLLRALAQDVMTILTERISEEYGFRFCRVRISSARGRWGSCNRRGEIAYTLRIAFLPPRLCEYVAAHELAHTVYFNHGADFWREVERAVPDWKNRRKELKNHGYIMQYL